VERFAACRFVDHAEQNKLFPVKQSAYRRHHSTSINDVPLSWFHSYLTDRTQSINVNGFQWVCSAVACRVPQGSVLGAIEFICYTEDVVAVFNCNSVDHHLYADDKQLYSVTTVTDIDTTRASRQLYSRRSWVRLSTTTVKSLNAQKNRIGVIWKCC